MFSVLHLTWGNRSIWIWTEHELDNIILKSDSSLTNYDLGITKCEIISIDNDVYQDI